MLTPLVIGYRRVPEPPANTMPFMFIEFSITGCNVSETLWGLSGIWFLESICKSDDMPEAEYVWICGYEGLRRCHCLMGEIGLLLFRSMGVSASL